MKTHLTEQEIKDRLHNLIKEEVEVGDVHWWWLSFADGDLPEGSQFLGVAIVEAPGFISAVESARFMGINPGGECRGLEIPKHLVPPSEFTNRLLSRTDCEEFDRIVKKQ